MKHLFTIIGTAIAGMFVMSVWGAFAGAYGIAGGWFAGLMIISTMWYLNHYIGVHANGGAWVDMALGIGTAGFMRGVFENGISYGTDALPTLLFVLIGGTIGGIAAVGYERLQANSKEDK